MLTVTWENSATPASHAGTLYRYHDPPFMSYQDPSMTARPAFWPLFACVATNGCNTALLPCRLLYRNNAHWLRNHGMGKRMYS